MNDELSPVEKVLDRLEEYTERRDEFRARCPAHNGTSADSLSVKEGDDGRALLICHAGCELQKICDALGISVVDLFVHSESENGTTKKVTRKTNRITNGEDSEDDRILATEDLPDGTYWEFTSPSGEVLYLQRHKREVYRRVGYGLWKKGLNGMAQVLYNLPELIGGVRAGEPIFHLEGPKDVETARERLGVVATTSGGTNSWRSSYREHYIGADVTIIPDNDESGRKYAAEVAQSIAAVARSVKVVDLPDLEEGGDLTDWLDAGHTGQEFFAAVEKALEGATESYVPANDEWEDPVPLAEGLPPVASLDPAMLPRPLRGWIVDVSERMQIPPDFAAVGAVVVAASLIGRKVGIHPKRRDNWLAVPSLWGAVVGRPSLMKSPALTEVMKPLARLVAEAYEEHQEAMVAYELDVMVAEATKAALKDELKKAAKEAAKSGNRSKLDEIARRSQNTEVPKEPVLKRYKTEDATVEKISEILLENPRGILVHRDELSGWLRNLDKQGREGDRSFYLEAWNGTGSFDVDRIGRGSLHVPALCLSILGSIQPGPLATYVYQATQGEKGDDGLLQRFQLLVWPDPSPSWRNVDRWPDTKAKDQAYEVFRRLDALNPENFGAGGDDEEGIPAVRFTVEAQEVFDRWRDELEDKVRTADLPPALESHLAKYRSLMPSLALIFQIIEYVDDTAKGGAVGLRPALQAAAWCEYLESHATRLYSSAENPAMEGARALLERIRKGDVSDGDSTRSVYRKHWAKLSTPEEVNSACAVLEEFGWLRIEVAKTSGRSTTRLCVHPSLRELT
jgi:putative DNA primase/helicase